MRPNCAEKKKERVGGRERGRGKGEEGVEDAEEGQRGENRGQPIEKGAHTTL